ncbi:MAG TPA: hypothetical protein VHT50_20175 [Mycobacterium sp.]|jgi:hypothetical protein|nr:hypothetical protein [Mycobacterium sp.]
MPAAAAGTASLAADIGVGQGDVDVVARWLTARGEILDDVGLKLELRSILDPAEHLPRGSGRRVQNAATVR